MAEFNKTISIKTVADRSSLDIFRNEVNATIGKLQEKQITLSIDSREFRTNAADIAKLQAALSGVEKAAGAAGKSFDGQRMAKALSYAKTEMTKLTDSTGAAQKEIKNLERAYEGLQSAVRNQDGMINANAQAMSHYRKEIGLVDKAMTTLSKTMLWSTANKTFDAMIQSAQDAVQYIYKLDESLNQIRLVSGMTSTEVANLAVEANKSAKALGQTTVSYTDAAMLYLQQGKSLLESQKMAEATMVATNITGEKSTKVVELMTSAMNGFNYSSDKAMEVLDKFAAVGAATASDFNELATGFSKVASMAKTAEVSFDQLNSMIATVASATREAPETIGTSFKTIFARMQSLKQGLDEDGNAVDMAELGRYTQQVKDATGISFFNEDGQLREAGALMEDIGNAWQTMSKNTKTIVAEAMAGQRQASRLHALFNSWDEYKGTLQVSMDAEGTAMEQNAVRMDSLQVASNRLKASFEDLYDSLINKEGIGTFLEMLTSAVDAMTRLADAAGGFSGIMAGIGPILAGLALPKIMNSVTNAMNPIGELDAISQRRSGRVGGVQMGAVGKLLNRADRSFSDHNAAKSNYASQNNMNIEDVDVKSQAFKDHAKKYQNKTLMDEISGIQDTTVLAEAMNIPHDEAARLQADIRRQKAVQDEYVLAEKRLAELKSQYKDMPVSIGDSGKTRKDGTKIYQANLREDLQAKESDNDLAKQAIAELTEMDGEKLKRGTGSREQMATLQRLAAARSVGNRVLDEDALSEIANKYFSASDDVADVESFKESLRKQIAVNDEKHQSQVNESTTNSRNAYIREKADKSKIYHDYGKEVEELKREKNSVIDAKKEEVKILEETYKEAKKLSEQKIKTAEKISSIGAKEFEQEVKKEYQDAKNALPTAKSEKSRLGKEYGQQKKFAEQKVEEWKRRAEQDKEEAIAKATGSQSELDSEKLSVQNAEKVLGAASMGAGLSSKKSGAPSMETIDSEIARLKREKNAATKLQQASQYRHSKLDYRRMNGLETFTEIDENGKKTVERNPLGFKSVMNTGTIAAIPEKAISVSSEDLSKTDDYRKQMAQATKYNMEMEKAKKGGQSEAEIEKDLAKKYGKTKDQMKEQFNKSSAVMEAVDLESLRQKMSEAERAAAAELNKYTSGTEEYEEALRIGTQKIEEAATLVNNQKAKMSRDNINYDVSTINPSYEAETERYKRERNSANYAFGEKGERVRPEDFDQDEINNFLNGNEEEGLQSVDARIEELEKLKSMRERIDAKKLEIEAAQTEIDNNVQTIENEYSQKINNLNEGLELSKEALQKELNSKLAAVDTELQGKKDALEAEKNSRLAEISAMKDQDSEKLQTEASLELERLQSEFEENLAQMQQEAQKAIQEAEKEYEKGLKEAQNKKDQALVDAEEKAKKDKKLATANQDKLTEDTEGVRAAENALRTVESNLEIAQEISATENEVITLGANLDQLEGTAAQVGETMNRAFNAERVGQVMQVGASFGMAAIQLGNTLMQLKDVDNEFEVAKVSAKGLLTSIAAIGPSFGPVGMGVSAVAMVLAGLADPIIDMLDPLVQVEKKNQKILDLYYEQKEALNSKLSSMQSVLTAQQSLEKEIQEAGGIGLASEDQLAKYREIQNQIAELDSTTVAYYTAAGDAVLKHNSSLDDQITKTKEALLAQEDLLINNRLNFFEQSIISSDRAEESIVKYQEKIEQLNISLADMDPTSKKYMKTMDQITEYQTRLSDAQKTLSDSKSNIQDNIISPLLKTNEVLSGTDETKKGFVSGFLDVNDVAEYQKSLAGAAKEAEALGVNLKEVGMDAAGQAKLMDSYIEKQEEKISLVSNAINAIRTDQSESGVKIAGALMSANETTKDYIGTLVGLTTTGQGAISMMKDLGAAINDHGVISSGFSVSSNLLKATEADLAALQNQLRLNKKAQEVAVASAPPRAHADRIQAADPTKVPTNANDAMNMSSNTYHKGSYLTQREFAEYQTLDPQVQAANEARLATEQKINEVQQRRAQLMNEEILMAFQLEQARSNYYLDMASTEEGHNALAKTYSEDYAKTQSLMGASYQETEESKYDYNTRNGIAMNEAEQATAKEETITIITETDFGNTIDDFNNLIKDLEASTEGFGETFIDEIAASMEMGIDEVETSMDRMAKIMQGEGMIDALAGNNEEMKALLEEFAEEGANASDEAISAAYEAADARIQAQGEMYAAMNANDAAYWQTVIQANQDEINLTTATTGIKVQDYSTYAEYKAAMRQWEAENAGWLANEEVATAVWAANEQILANAHKKAQVLLARGDEQGAKDTIAAAEADVQANAENAKIAMAWDAAAEIVRAGGTALKIVVENFQKTFKGIASLPGVSGVLDGFLGGIDSMVGGIATDFEGQGKQVINSMNGGWDASVEEDTLQSQHKPSGSGGGGAGSGGGGSIDHDIDLLPGSKPPAWSGGPSAPNTGMPGSNTGGGGNGGSGKNPSSGKEAAAKEQEDMEWEKDWYHDINILIEKNADALEKLSDIEERTYGEQRLKNMREQATLLQQQYELKKQALEIAKQEAAHYKDLISKEGVSFNGDGSVKDYNAFIQGKVNAANAIADADAKKAAQENVKELIDNIKKYEDVMFGTIFDYENEIEQARQEAQDKILEALEYEFEIVIKIKQIIIDDNDFLNEFLEGIDTAGDILGRLSESGMAQLETLADLGDKFKEVSELDLDPGPKIEKLEEIKEELLEAFSTLKDLNDAISEAIIDSINKNVEALEYAFEQLEHITSSAQNMIDLNQLFGNGEDYEAVNAMMGVIAEANELQLSSMMNAKEELVSLRDALEEGTEEWKAANDAVLEMDANIQQMTIETIKLYQEQLTNAFNGIMRDIEKAMSGGTSLEKLRKEIALVREEQDRYADSIDQTLFKQRMLAQIQQDISNTTDPKKQQMLQEFYDKQVATLGEKGALLESELTRTEMLYNITLAQMALEDARNNKSIMKLTRDDQGNWSYQYMADMAAVQAAQDNLSQQLADLMEFDKQQFQATQDYILQKREEYLANMQELHGMYLNGEFESEADYQAAMESLTQEFNDQMLQLEADYGDLKLNLNQSTLSALQGELIDFTDLQSEQWADLYEQVNAKTTEGLATLEGTWDTMRQAIQDKILNPETGINKYLQDYANKVDEIAKLTGYDDLKNSSNGLLDASKNLSTQLETEKKKHEELHNAMKNEFNEIKNAVKPGGVLDELRKAYEKIRKEIESYISKINEAIKKQKELGNSKPTTGTPGNGNGSSSGSGSGSTTTPPKKFPGDTNNNGKPDKGEKVRIKPGVRWYHDSAGMNPSGNAASDRDFYVVNTSGNKYGIAVGTNSNISSAQGWVRQSDLVGFESGGYLTGGFGNQGGADGKNGKLAMLHEKELVLNKQDTANMLEMINMTRDFYKSPNLSLDGFKNGIQQTVNINADFSGVRNSAEIEDAFENLVNKAIQYTK